MTLSGLITKSCHRTRPQDTHLNPSAVYDQRDLGSHKHPGTACCRPSRGPCRAPWTVPGARVWVEERTHHEPPGAPPHVRGSAGSTGKLCVVCVCVWCVCACVHARVHREGESGQKPSHGEKENPSTLCGSCTVSLHTREQTSVTLSGTPTCEAPEILGSKRSRLTAGAEVPPQRILFSASLGRMVGAHSRGFSGSLADPKFLLLCAGTWQHRGPPGAGPGASPRVLHAPHAACAGHTHVSPPLVMLLLCWALRFLSGTEGCVPASFKSAPFGPPATCPAPAAPLNPVAARLRRLSSLRLSGCGDALLLPTRSSRQ